MNLFLYKGAEYVDSSINKLEFPILDLADSEKPLTRSQKKNLRKKLKKKDIKSSEYAFEIEEITTTMEEIKFSEEDSSKSPTSIDERLPIGSSRVVETEHLSKNKLRTLKKKLKQIEDLEERLTMGEVNPNREQILKISKKK